MSGTVKKIAINNKCVENNLTGTSYAKFNITTLDR